MVAEQQRLAGLAPVGGSSDLTLKSDGTTELTVSMHDSGYPSENVTVAWAIRAASGTAYTRSLSVHVQGTDVFPSSPQRDGSASLAGYNAQVAANWADFVASTAHWTADTTVDPGPLVQQAVTLLGIVSSIKSL
jgi:hypothetical protein